MKLEYSGPQNYAYIPRIVPYEVTKVFQDIITYRKIAPTYGINSASTFVVPQTDYGSSQLLRIQMQQQETTLVPDRVTDVRGQIINGS